VKNANRNKWISLFIGGCIGLVGGILLSPTRAQIPVPNTAAPADTLDLVVCILLIATLHAAHGIYARRQLKRVSLDRRHSRAPLRRPTTAIGTVFFRNQVILLLVLFVFLRNDSWTWQSVGFKQEMPWMVAFAMGVTAYVALISLLTVLVRLQGTFEEQADHTLVNMAHIWPRQPAQKMAMILAACLINPVTEELIYRGILVHQLSIAVSNYELPILVGLLVSLGNHAYQGRRSVLLHATFYFVAVGLLFSPAGLMGAIGMHYAGDFVPFASISRGLKSYRARHSKSESPPEGLLAGDMAQEA
jgi:membrane protease YdiL (CAAX protease family)